MILGFYGDDFTGSTDALEQVALAGWKARLFMRLPDPAALDECRGFDAVGIAGISRSLPTEAMEDELRPAFAILRGLSPGFIHYKVCSTFDSSPETGSIGKAIQIGRNTFPNAWIPVLVGAPALGRYCVFGNLFARMGTGGTGEIHRLDRHPSMRSHPVTPATESDLRLHLAHQISHRTGLIDVLDLERPVAEIIRKIDSLTQNGFGTILFDALHDDHVRKVGEVLATAAAENQPLFSVGSSSVERALVSAAPKRNFDALEAEKPAAPLLVLCGSRSPVTAAQIRHARDTGFALHALDVPRLLDPAERDNAIRGSVRAAIDSIAKGKNVILHTDALGEAVPGAQDSARVLGAALGQCADAVLRNTATGRVVIAGGDTSGHAARALGIDAVDVAARFRAGAPLCLARSKNPHIHGTEVIFKGGQVGDDRFFSTAAGIDSRPVIFVK